MSEKKKTTAPKSAEEKEQKNRIPENVSGAEKFIDFLCRGDIAAMNYEYVGYAIPNTAAIDIIGADEYNASPVNNPPQEALDHCQVFKYLGDDTKLYDQIWTEIISEF